MGRCTAVVLSILLIFSIVAAPLRAEHSPEFDSLLAWYKTHYDFTKPDDTVYTFDGEYQAPEGFHAPDSAGLSEFAAWIQNFPIWHRWKSVGKWDGGKMYEFSEISRVVHIPWTGPTFRDRAIPIRLIGEYLWYRNRQLDMAVVPPSGVELTYPVWLSGKPSNNARMELIIKPGTKRDSSDTEYYQFLTFAMANVTYKSLARNCDSIAPGDIMPGDLFITYDSTGKSGQVYVIMHVVQNDLGDKRFIVATGGTEACDFYIPRVNPDRENPWITREDIAALNSGYPNAGFYRLHLAETLR